MDLRSAAAVARQARAPEDRARPLHRPADVLRRRNLGLGERSLDTLLRTGADLSVENPFGQGGELQVGAEFDSFEFDTPDEDDDDETVLRLDRLSYSRAGRASIPSASKAGASCSTGCPSSASWTGWNGRTGATTATSFGREPRLHARARS
jgi:hypothetical protein